ncbi:hypothetical protein SDC9_66110 [bioreactor metagenome]|uniref:Uncharacterized protein n=1 Tax=bioreactor metagenome TaxID=1076179 RepID=A0A644Y0C7_9ZZZZ
METGDGREILLGVHESGIALHEVHSGILLRSAELIGDQEKDVFEIEIARHKIPLHLTVAVLERHITLKCLK